ncbi:glycoside hydrolase family 3 N-terminal domain-containing protein [Kitasatospora sp. NBC_01539]|uniref:glycoside hydrolase family 3 protein n=1 Tax=Kitasatospora sp. NBC_01539 TaxID=2903577 RepID=UPI0038602B9C
MIRLDHLPEWPALQSDVPRDPAVEEAARGILAQMTTEEKLGQMIQPDLVELTADDVRTYRIGSALNGAGRWPGGNRRSGAREWAETVGAFWEASEEAFRDRPFRIPFMWATDAVHGHNNVYGATVFPHNIGLGAARDPELIRRIGEVTAREIVATGMDWTFAPTVTTPRDRRWGRHYEGYSEDPEIVHRYARAMVEGLQGDTAGLRSDTRVLACVKHWVGDGGTFEGEDRGIARCTEDVLRNVHAMGFFSGIEAGAQSVMASYSGWEGSGRSEPRMHGSRYLLTDVLKDALGFDGIVIGDWDAHPYVEGCSDGEAGNVIRAGVDVLMISARENWQAVHRAALAEIRSGAIPMERVDDAVLRVLRVKLRAGLWEKPRPQDRSLAGDAAVLGAPAHRALAREAVRRSLVLLKNDDGALPLPRTARVLVTGSAADAVQKQTGGYTVTWQGDDIGIEDFPGGATLATAVAEVVGADRCTVDPFLEHADPAAHDVAVVVIGEDAYAEMFGSIRPWRSIAYAALKPSYARDLETLRRLRAAGVRVVTVMYGGRPLYTTEEINLSDAFVAAWLPGPDATGVADLLFAAADGAEAYDFRGRLSFGWPRRRHAAAVNRTPRHIPGHVVPEGESAPTGPDEPLFPYGHGLTLRGDGAGTRLGVLPPDVDEPGSGAPESAVPYAVDAPVELGPAEGPAYVLRVRATDHGPRDLPCGRSTSTSFVSAEPVGHPAGGAALSLSFKGTRTFVYTQSRDGGHRDLRGLVAAGGRLAFDVRVVEPPAGPFHLACHDDYPQQPALDISARLRAQPFGEWTTLEFPLAELASEGMEFDHVDVPFQLWTEGRARLDVGRVRLLPPREDEH